MAKIIDITEKLNFEQKPQIKIKNEILTVNNEAAAILEIMPLLDTKEPTLANVDKICRTLFSEDDFVKIEKLHLSFGDFATLTTTAISLVTGDNSGEAVTHATT
ncbi:MAG: hypothetical protein K2M82_04635 [Lachnospiraceae bacterium]|nr:hypothetical protein [Lachnospiraceae bacterium]